MTLFCFTFVFCFPRIPYGAGGKFVRDRWRIRTGPMANSHGASGEFVRARWRMRTGPMANSYGADGEFVRGQWRIRTGPMANLLAGGEIGEPAASSYGAGGEFVGPAANSWAGGDPVANSLGRWRIRGSGGDCFTLR